MPTVCVGRPSEQAGDTVLNLPNLSPEFYEQHAALRVIHRAARSRQVPPDIVLGAVLGRLAALADVRTTVNRSPLNYIVAYIGESGTGKTTGVRVARDLVPNIGTELDGLEVGSGEGLVAAYLRDPRGDETEPVQQHSSGLFYVDEGQRLHKLANRQGSTILETLRTAWSGGTLGTANANKTTRRRLNAYTYRMSVGIGFQPKYAVDLLTDNDAGTPQRFVFVYARDPYVPNGSPPTWPGDLSVKWTQPGDVEVDVAIRNIVHDQRITALRTGHHDDPLNSHALELHLRTAALFGVLFHRGGQVDAETWQVAAEFLDNSRNIVRVLLENSQLEQENRRYADDEVKATSRARQDAFRERHIVERVAALIGRHVRHGVERQGELRNRVAQRDRHYFDTALLVAIETNYITRHSDDRGRPIYRPGGAQPPSS